MNHVPDRPITNDESRDTCLVCLCELDERGECFDHGSLDAQMEYMWSAQAEARLDREMQDL